VTGTRRAGAVLAACIAGAALAAPILTPHTPTQNFSGFEQAPPMWPHIVRPDGSLGRPYIRPITLVNPLERRYAEDSRHPIPVQWFKNGYVVSIDESRGPWLPLGSDALGRDVFARLLYGARLSLAVACMAAVGALALGLLIGGAAGFLGGRAETALMALADFVLVLPAIYAVLAIRAALPLVLTVPQVFGALIAVLAAVGWPVAARGVRAIVAGELRKEYAEAAYAVGASPLRILLRHLLPATTSFLVATGTMMVPAFLLAEGTLTFVGMGFPLGTATWGDMLRDAWQSSAFADAPWLMAPALAIVLTVLALHLLTSGVPAATRRAGTFQ
jgi:peptide/nickel transport system permease protein